ncbi:ABC transporter permease subunit (plasmid) [Bacillus sp. 31A1R]|uniref:ABC transporter permease subunit n=1 Tax=Robertmurraya mangrovi TaxID=3098077 RepID=A0ABU5IVE6_9BACI|nr:ABC transporter permease subunit [Bacillus sp. 31A1R]MDZ5471100.1 ABC transporter permease subunit [Bacillus sp. 31A1R]
MNMFFHELKAHRKSLMIWCIGVILMVVGGMSKYGGMEASGQSMNELMASMPKVLQSIMGTGSLDLSTVGGYFGVLFLYLMIMTSIHGAMLGANIVSKEERDKTAEFLLVKPVSRKEIITAKLLASLTNILILNITTLTASILIVNYYSEGDRNLTSEIVILLIGMFILQILFMVIGTAIASLNKNSKAATSLSTGLLLFTFLLSIIIDLNEKLEGLRFLTPFKYFEAKNILVGEGLEMVYLLLSLMMILASIWVTYFFYEKRDLRI